MIRTIEQIADRVSVRYREAKRLSRDGRVNWTEIAKKEVEAALCPRDEIEYTIGQVSKVTRARMKKPSNQKRFSFARH